MPLLVREVVGIVIVGTCIYCALLLRFNIVLFCVLLPIIHRILSKLFLRICVVIGLPNILEWEEGENLSGSSLMKGRIGRDKVINLDVLDGNAIWDEIHNGLVWKICGGKGALFLVSAQDTVVRILVNGV